jgi:peptide/nickel transport system substrate-binding protein
MQPSGVAGSSLGTTRRTFLRAAALIGGGALAAACQAPTPPASQQAPGATTAAKPAAAGEPRRGGTLTWAVWDKLDDIDPPTTTGAAAAEVDLNLLDSLIAIDGDQKIYPHLATKWTIEEGARRFTFTLRDDVKFHDGTPLDSTAVKRTWERVIDPATKAAGVVALLGPLDSMQTPDPRTLVVTFKEPYPPLLLQIWRPYFGVMSNKYLDTLKPGDKASAPVGSGPFKFGSRSADGVITLDAFRDYAWGHELMQNRRAPYLDSVKFRAITEASTRVATLESGENLLIDEISEPDFARLKADRRFAFVEAPRRSHTLGFFINVTKPPTDDLAVRQAINWSIDRKTIVEKIFFNVHKVGVGPLSEGVWGRSEEAEKRFGYDPKKAEQILEEAGWKTASVGGIRERNGQKLSAILATFRSPWTEMAEAMQAQLRAVGMDLQVQKMERGPYLDFTRDYKHNLNASASTNIDPDGILRVSYHSTNKARSNFSGVADAELDALLDKGATQDIGTPERRKTYEDAQTRLMDLAPFVGLMSQLRVEGMAAKVKGLRMSADGLNAMPLSDVWIDA